MWRSCEEVIAPHPPQDSNWQRMLIIRTSCFLHLVFQDLRHVDQDVLWHGNVRLCGLFCCMTHVTLSFCLFFWKFRFIFFKPRNAWHFFFACAGLTHEVLPTAAICRSHVSCSCLQVNDCLNSSSFKGCTVAGRLLRLGRLNSLVATGSLVGLSSQTKLQARSDWNMKHYISVEFLSNLNVKPPPCTNVKPPPLLTTSWRRFHDWSNEVVREDIFAHDVWFQILRISRFFHVTLLRALTSPSSASVTTSFVTSHCFSSSAHSMTCSLLQCNCYIFMRLLSYNLTLYLQFVVFITRLIFSVSPTTAHCDM